MAFAPKRLKPFVKLDAEWLRLPAWRCLSPYARALLPEIMARYRPGYNLMQISTRDAADMANCSRTRAGTALEELEECGWICIERVGRTDGPKERRASAYRLTMYKSEWNEPPSMDFMRWEAPRERFNPRPVRVKNKASNGSDIDQTPHANWIIRRALER